MSVRYIELMEQKSAVIARVLEITRAVSLTGKEESVEKEADAFSTLYEQREIILRRIPKIEAEMEKETDAMSANKLVSEVHQIRIKNIVASQKEMATELIALDEANFKVYEKLKSHLAGDLKTVRQSKDVNERYNEDFYDDTRGYYFDKKN
jgi:hypothetical protein